MNLKDLSFETGEIKGEFIPGIVILANLVLILKDDLLKEIDIYTFLSDYQFIIIVLIIIIAYILGSINSLISFRLRKLLAIIFKMEEPLEDFIIRKKMLNKEGIIQCFKEEFGEEILEENYWNFHFDCREKYIQLNPEGHKHSIKVANRVRYKVAMIIPLLLTGIIIMFYTNFSIFFSIACIIISILFAIGTEEKRREEARVIFLNYYDAYQMKKKDKSRKSH